MSDPAGFDDVPVADALDIVAGLIDNGADRSDLGLIDEALALADRLETRDLTPDERLQLDYFRANAWGCHYAERHSNRDRLWDWEQPELRQQLFLLRRARDNEAFASADVGRRCQVLTNLGNVLSTLGRFVEARVSWTSALSIEPRFWMARGNRGSGLMHYARALYDPGHAAVLALRAHRDLSQAVADIGEHPELGDASLAALFSGEADAISRALDLDGLAAAHRSDGWSLGRGRPERRYRHWCLDNILFVNPLNDVEQASVAACDVLTLPDFTTGIGDPPIVVGMFNQLKQEFVSARWLLYEGIGSMRTHLSDRDVLLYNTLDYAAYGLGTEKLKIAFRMGYSIFDKIAYFLNHYLALGIPETRVSFRSLWREKPNGPLRPQFASSTNWPLRGLYWLSKDLFEEGLRESTEPDARALAELRNHLEHKYVKVHEFSVPRAGDWDPFRDTLAFSIGRDALERRTKRLLALARAALIYLSLAMHHEERNRAAGRTKQGLAMPMPLDPLRDGWKR